MTDKGRENKRDNDLFFTCSLIEYISRKTKNIRADVVNKLGETRISKIYELADVYHCDNIDSVRHEFIADANIRMGEFDNVSDCGYALPSYWDIGKVYKRLIKMVADHEKIEIVDALTIALFIMKIQITFLNAIRKIRYYKEYGCRMLVSDEEKPTWKKKL